MADRNVKVAIIGDASSLNRAMKQGADSTEQFGGVFASISQGVVTKGAALGLFIADAAMQVGQAMAQMAADAALWLPRLGAEFDEANDKIRVAVGNNPLLNLSLGESFEAVYRTTASGMDATSTAIALLYQRLGLTGQPLQDLAKQLLDLSRITGGDAATNIDAVSKAFVNWGVPAESAGASVDFLLRAMQETGIPLERLASDLTDSGLQLRALGFSFEDATTLIAGLSEAGIDLSDVMPGLNRALAEAARQGKPAAAAFDEWTTAIRDAPSDTEAFAIAVELLGARAGPKLAGAIREGKLSMEELYGVIAGGTDTVAGATSATDDWAEKWTIFWHEIQIAAKPAADWIFQTLGDITTAFQEGGIAAAWDVVITKWGELKGKLTDWWNNTFQPWWDGVASPWINDVLIPGMRDGFTRWADGIWSQLEPKMQQFLSDFATWAMTDGAVAATKAGVVIGYSMAVGVLNARNTMISAGIDLAVGFVTGFASALWNGVTAAFQGVARWLADNVRRLVPDIPGIPFRAVGGPVAAGMPYIVGERGPELFVPGQSGGIVPNNKLGQMGGGGGEMVAKVYLDGKQIAQAIAKREKASR